MSPEDLRQLQLELDAAANMATKSGCAFAVAALDGCPGERAVLPLSIALELPDFYTIVAIVAAWPGAESMDEQELARLQAMMANAGLQAADDVLEPASRLALEILDLIANGEHGPLISRLGLWRALAGLYAARVTKLHKPPGLAARGLLQGAIAAAAAASDLAAERKRSGNGTGRDEAVARRDCG